MVLALFGKLWALLGAAALLVWVAPLPANAAPAFMAGEALFAVNFMALVIASRRLLAGASSSPGGARSVVAGLVTIGKIVVLGGGAYLALVTFDLRVDFFVGGLCAALALLTLLLYLNGAKASGLGTIN